MDFLQGVPKSGYENIGRGKNVEENDMEQIMVKESSQTYETKNKESIDELRYALSAVEEIAKNMQTATKTLNKKADYIRLLLKENESLKGENEKLEAKVEALNKKFSRLTNYNKNPEVAQRNSKAADKRALEFKNDIAEILDEGHKTNVAIAKQLTKRKIKTPSGKEEWQDTTVRNIRKRLSQMGFNL